MKGATLKLINLDAQGMPVREAIDLTRTLAIELDIGTGVIELGMDHGVLTIQCPTGVPTIQPWAANAIHLTVDDYARRLHNASKDTE